MVPDLPPGSYPVVVTILDAKSNQGAISVGGAMPADAAEGTGKR